MVWPGADLPIGAQKESSQKLALASREGRPAWRFAHLIITSILHSIVILKGML
jgi:hypothetical protein